jgi:hypothetical protein
MMEKMGKQRGERSVPILREFKNLVLLQRYCSNPRIAHEFSKYWQPIKGQQALAERTAF